MAKPVFDVHYADGRTSLVMEADLDRGWTKRLKTYGYFQQSKIPYRNDQTIRAQLAVIAQPAGFEEWAKSFPDVESKSGDSDLSYDLRHRHLSVKVALSPASS
jgi:hypothetical protein